MNSFNCQICGKVNRDSISGYVSGCEHYPPEQKGIYWVYHQNKDPKRIKLDAVSWDNPEFKNIHHWEKDSV